MWKGEHSHHRLSWDRGFLISTGIHMELAPKYTYIHTQNAFFKVVRQEKESSLSSYSVLFFSINGSFIPYFHSFCLLPISPSYPPRIQVPWGQKCFVLFTSVSQGPRTLTHSRQLIHTEGINLLGTDFPI